MDWTTDQQAEIDRIVKSRLEREKEKFSDYDTIKTQLDELHTYKASAEYNLQMKVKEALEQKETELKGTYESQLTEIKATQLRDKVLQQAGVKLPQAYQAMIAVSVDEAEVKASLDAVTKAWQEELKELGFAKSDKDIGTPGNPTGGARAKAFKKMSYSEKEELYKKDPELYKKLRDNNK